MSSFSVYFPFGKISHGFDDDVEGQSAEREPIGEEYIEISM